MQASKSCQVNQEVCASYLEAKRQHRTEIWLISAKRNHPVCGLVHPSGPKTTCRIPSANKRSWCRGLADIFVSSLKLSKNKKNKVTRKPDSAVEAKEKRREEDILCNPLHRITQQQMEPSNVKTPKGTLLSSASSSTTALLRLNLNWMSSLYFLFSDSSWNHKQTIIYLCSNSNVISDQFIC